MSKKPKNDDVLWARAYVELAKTCFSQAKATPEPKIAKALRAMGRDYLAKARKIDPTIADISTD